MLASEQGFELPQREDIASFTLPEPFELGENAAVDVVIADVQLFKLVSLSSDCRYVLHVVLMPEGIVCKSRFKTVSKVNKTGKTTYESQRGRGEEGDYGKRLHRRQVYCSEKEWTSCLVSTTT